jgi:5-formyltetrahydrofolate cyclo-ligase
MDKASLRQHFLEKRKVLSPETVRQQSQQLAGRLGQLLAPRPPLYLHTYLPDATRHEPDTLLMAAELQARWPGLQLVVPRVVPGTRTLEHYLYTPHTPLLTNRWGLREPDPQQATPVAPEQLDVVLVPLLAFDTRGYRVGYGGGYYDRFLARCRPGTLKIGLSFFDPVERIDDLDTYDIRLDHALCPQQTWSW